MSTGTNLLKELIIKKYGIEKFDTGVQLVMQWLNAETSARLIYKDVHNLACKKSTPRFTRIQKSALKKLFGENFDP